VPPSAMLAAGVGQYVHESKQRRGTLSWLTLSWELWTRHVVCLLLCLHLQGTNVWNSFFVGAVRFGQHARWLLMP
jgi:hypothetical protein